MRKKEDKNKPISEKKELILRLAKFGRSLNEIAEVILVSREDLDAHLKHNTEFKNEIKVADKMADLRVEESLFKKATGYDTVEHITIFIPTDENGESFKIKEKREVNKYIPADTTSAISWLINRRPDRWSKNPAANADLNETQLTVLRDVAEKIIDENS
jgi:hypothetical protein